MQWSPASTATTTSSAAHAPSPWSSRRFAARPPTARVEVLIPDFQGNPDAIRAVVEARPDVLNHNTESVPASIAPSAPARATSVPLSCCASPKSCAPQDSQKSGVMVGLGEETSELLEVFRDLARVHCDILTIGQYLRPRATICPCPPLHPREFADLKTEALRLGFRHVESGPLVRSSYHAHEQAASLGCLL